MSANNFVSRVSEEELLEFANKYIFANQKTKYNKILILPSNDKCVSVMFLGFKNGNSKAVPETKSGAFCMFYYSNNPFGGGESNEENIFSLTYNQEWRKFMAKKFGIEYVKEYEKFAKELTERKVKFWQSMRAESDYEVEELMSCKSSE